METALIIFTSLYCFAVVLVLGVLAKKRQPGHTANKPFISVIIAARNEAKRIKPTLESLVHIKYPVDKFEIIFIDDRSLDDTAQFIDAYVKEMKNWQLIRISGELNVLSGKKNALKSGIEKARGDIILTTDADCIVPENWLSDMAQSFTKNTSMVLGHALLLTKKGCLDKLLRFDNLFSGIMAAAPTLLGFPMSSVGRNMAYRKDAYVKSGGYADLAKFKSGDDVHLTELFRRKVAGKITFNLNKGAYTHSRTPDTFKEILHQQVRKNSKLLKKSASSISISIILFVYHFLLIASPFLSIVSLKTWILLLGLKLLTEFITLAVAAIKLADSKLIPYLPLMQIIYPVYVSVMGFAGVFQKFEWKA